MSIGIGLVFSSLALFGSLRALRRIYTIHEVSLGRLKQNTSKKLEILLNEYLDAGGDIAIGEPVDFYLIVEHLIEMDQTLVEKREPAKPDLYGSLL